MIPHRKSDGSILVGKKARGFGKGKWVGFGGKQKPGETISEANVREMFEETGVVLQEEDVRKVGLLLYTFDVDPTLFLEVHVFDCDDAAKLENLNTLNDEYEGAAQWMKNVDIPYDEMWVDFKLWSKYLLDGTRFIGRVKYSDYNTVYSENFTFHDDKEELEAQINWT